MSPYSIIPFEVRIAGIALLALGLWWGWDELKDSLVEAALSKQNAAVAEQAARDSAAAVKRLEGDKARLQTVLKDREKRAKVAEAKAKESDDEMERLKRERPEVAEWAKQPVPDPVRARHGGVR